MTPRLQLDMQLATHLNPVTPALLMCILPLSATRHTASGRRTRPASRPTAPSAPQPSWSLPLVAGAAAAAAEHHSWRTWWRSSLGGERAVRRSRASLMPPACVLPTCLPRGPPSALLGAQSALQHQRLPPPPRPWRPSGPSPSPRRAGVHPALALIAHASPLGAPTLAAFRLCAGDGDAATAAALRSGSGAAGEDPLVFADGGFAGRTGAARSARGAAAGEGVRAGDAARAAKRGRFGELPLEQGGGVDFEGGRPGGSLADPAAAAAWPASLYCIACLSSRDCQQAALPTGSAWLRPGSGYNLVAFDTPYWDAVFFFHPLVAPPHPQRRSPSTLRTWRWPSTTTSWATSTGQVCLIHQLASAWGVMAKRGKRGALLEGQGPDCSRGKGAAVSWLTHAGPGARGPLMPKSRLLGGMPLSTLAKQTMWRWSACGRARRRPAAAATPPASCCGARRPRPPSRPAPTRLGAPPSAARAAAR